MTLSPANTHPAPPSKNGTLRQTIPALPPAHLAIVARGWRGAQPNDDECASLNGHCEIVRDVASAFGDVERQMRLLKPWINKDDFERITSDEAEPVDESALAFTAKYVAPRFNIGDALKPQPAIDWLIDGMVETGGVFGVFGKPGSKKTYSMMDMAVCVAMGIPWLGRKNQTMQGAMD